MAQVVLGGLGGAIGGGLGRIVGGAVGGMIDRGLVAGLQPARQKGPRLSALSVQGAAEGAPMACVFGRARDGPRDLGGAVSGGSQHVLCRQGRATDGGV